MPLDITLLDETGKSLRLADLTNSRPSLLVFGYFRCTKLCGVLRDNALATLTAAGATPGKDYDFLAISIDPDETPADAARAKAESMAHFPSPDARDHWRFLTGSVQATMSVARAAGFDYVYDKTRNSFAHPLGIVVTFPPGLIAGYQMGVDFDPAKMRVALAQAAVGKVAEAAQPVLLLCFDFDPTTGRYTLAILKLLRILVVAVVLAGALVLVRMTRQRDAA